MNEVIDGLPDTEYHARPELGSTSVKTLAKYPPAVYRWQADNPQPHKAVFDAGKAAHSLILEGSTAGVDVHPFDSWRTKAAQEGRRLSYENDRIPMLEHDYAVVEAMHQAVMDHPVAGPLLTDHIPERSYFKTLQDVPVKARPDAINGTTVVDLKTTGADLNDLARNVNSFGYHIQQAHYEAVMEACGQTVDDFVFVFVSTQAPHMVRVIRLDDAAVDLGNDRMMHALEVYRHCTTENHWPGYEAIDTLDLPGWVYYQDENEETEMTL